MKILPIAKLNIDWPQYLKNTKELLGKSVSEDLDKRHITVGDLSSYLLTLREFSWDNNDNDSHLFFSFLILETKNNFFELLQQDYILFGIKKTLREDVYLAISSGTFKAWKDFIWLFSNSKNYDLRLLAKELLLYFEKEGLQFYEYHKTNKQDGTILLTEK